MASKRQKAEPQKNPVAAPAKASVVVQKIVDLYGGKRGLAMKLGGKVSRPLLVALCSGTKPTTAASVAELCRAAPAHLAEELIAAHLSDEFEKIQSRYRSEDSILPPTDTAWSGERPKQS